MPVPQQPSAVLQGTGRRGTISLPGLAPLGRFLRFAVDVFAQGFVRPLPIAATIAQTLEYVGRCALPVIFVVGGFSLAIAIQAAAILQMVGADTLLGGFATLLVFREFAPVVAALMVALQSGSSTTTELGAMRMKEEFDAMHLIAVNPVHAVVAPRVFAFLLAAPILNALGAMAGSLAAYIGSQAKGYVSAGTYLISAHDALSFVDFANGCIKAAVFGLLIGLIATYHGYHAQGGAEGVGRAANRAVVQSVIAFFIANSLLTALLIKLQG